jgi:hypothetical protein
MKSLEIVNELIECFEDKVEFQKDFLKANPKEKPNPIFERQLNGCKQIKQDLEVLEILRKYLYIVENQIPRTDDYFEILETDLDEMQDDENCDDFYKVKQWLGVNLNEKFEDS